MGWGHSPAVGSCEDTLPLPLFLQIFTTCNDHPYILPGLFRASRERPSGLTSALLKASGRLVFIHFDVQQYETVHLMSQVC
jgi:hypothetical protein